MKDTTIATVRTALNTSVLTAICAGLARLFGWEIEVADLLPLMPVIVPVVAIFYRASLVIAERFPIVGRILFGFNEPPRYDA